MDPLDFAEFETLTRGEDKTDESLDFVFIDDEPDPPLPSTAPPKLASIKDHDLLFSLDEGPSAPAPAAQRLPAASASVGSQDLFSDFEFAGDDEPPAAPVVDGTAVDHNQSGLLDDFFGVTPVSSSTDPLPELEALVSDVAPVSDVDLLFGVGVDQPEQTADIRVTNPPDVLEFLDSSTKDPPTAMESHSVPTEPRNERVDAGVKQNFPPDITITAGHDEDENKAKEKRDDEAKEQMEATTSNKDGETDKVDGIPTNGQDYDFSILELPGTAHLNLDLSKHKRTLSQKGSIARRKRPTRAAILNNDNEDSLYLDSSESKLLKTDDLDGCASSKAEKPDTPPPPVEEDKDRSTGDPRKHYGGVKIPGLLEGLNKSKAFSKIDKAETDPEKKTESKIPTSSSKTQPAPAENAPQIRSKPLVLPRVLPSVIPRPASKVQKETQNHSTVNESSPSKVLLGKDKLSTTATEQRDTKPSYGANRVLPSKPVLNIPASAATGQDSTKPTAKVPPPVPSKPSVPLKPPRTNLLGSASFSVADRPGLSKKGALPPLASLNGGLASVDSTDSADAALTNQILATSSGSKASFTASGTVPQKELLPAKESITAEKEGSKNVMVTRASSLRAPGSIGYTDRFKFKPREVEKDVNSSPSPDISRARKDSSAEDAEKPEPSDSAKENQAVPRKSSISGISSVKSPSVADKVQSGSGSRRGSFTGSAYNPIGFRPTVSVDGETSKSRSNSISEDVSVISPPIASDVKPIKDLTNGGESSRLRVSSFNSVSNSQSTVSNSQSTVSNSQSTVSSSQSTVSSSQSTVSSSQSKVSSSQPTVSSSQPTVSSSQPTVTKGKNSEEPKPNIPAEEKKKDATDEVNKIIRDQSKLIKEPVTPQKTFSQPSVQTKTESQQDKACPWNVRLRKVEKREKTPEPQVNPQETKDMPNNWLQQMAQKRRSVVTTKGVTEPEKTKDTTPEWARASIHRRQRLIESGIISADGMK